MVYPRISGFLRCSLVSVHIVLVGCASQTHTVYVGANTDPPYPDIVVSEDSKGRVLITFAPDTIVPGGLEDRYVYEMTTADMNQPVLHLPDMVFVKEGYLPYEFKNVRIDLDDEFWNSGFKHYYRNTDKIVLKKDPDFLGSTTKPNKIKVTTNSEPAGAKIYEDGKLCGTTPCTLNYTVNKAHHAMGEFRCAPLVAYKEGFLPQEKQLTFEIDPDLRYTPGSHLERATVFFLKPDPDYRAGAQFSGRATSGSRTASAQYTSAKAEYEQALSEYNQALETLDEAKSNAQVNRMTSSSMTSSDKGWVRGVSALNTVTDPSAIRNAERKVAIARQRLDRARARLEALDWK